MEKITTKIIFSAVLLLLLPSLANSASLGDVERLFIESAYDNHQRRNTEAELKLITNHIYFYVDKRWWKRVSEEDAKEYERVMYSLGGEFEKNIYPRIKQRFGVFPKHNVVGEGERINILFHPMGENFGGYFRSGDQYSIYQYPRSNEKNILYLNSSLIENPNLRGYLAHEYMHLVTFNEKNKEFGISEEVWLNELRAELIISSLGYNDDYENSNLRQRVRTFLRDPDISLTEWTEQIADYGVINAFGEYLVGHYGEKILMDSLNSQISGIPSIDYALEKNEVGKTFSEIFTEWMIAVYLNDCKHGDYYCYKNEKLKDFSVSPATVFIPTRDDGSVTVRYQTKNWAGNWHRIVGGSGDLYLDFYGDEIFNVPYILCEKDGNCEVSFLEIDEEGEGSVVIEEFNSRYESVVILPHLQQKFTGFNGPEKPVSFEWQAEVREENDEEKLKQEELRELSERLSLIRSKIEEISLLLGIGSSDETSLDKIREDLHYGMRRSREVENLQLFLKNQGEEIYPEGLVTGNFLVLTKRAVIRFQERHAEEILDPLGLSEGTGYVGVHTRELINSFLNN